MEGSSKELEAGRLGRFTPAGLLLRTLKVWTANVLPFTAVAIVLDLPLAALNLRGASPEDPRTAALLLVVMWFVRLIASGALSIGVLQALAGTRPRATAMLVKAARQLWPVFAVAGVYTLLVLFGLFALVVPGVFVYVAGYLAVPAVLAEPELGTEGALRRSFALTQGHRTALLAVVASLAVLELVGMLGTTWLAEGPLSASPIAGMAAAVVVDAVLGGFVLSCAAVAYHDLLVLKRLPVPRGRSSWPA